ncbi:MAG: hypothetical protein FWC67_04650, partial [Defluviitaleaceae bacterium]|nr:hypothetical protein [Defluviitaleaceae bacterium]
FLLVILLLASACGRDEYEIEHEAEYEIEYDYKVTSYIWEEWELEYVNIDEWKEDIEHFRATILRRHPKFADRTINTLHRNIEIGEAFNERIDQLINNVPYLTKFEILAELQRSLVVFENSHFQFGASSSLLRGEQVAFLYQITQNRYPLEFGWFDDGFYLFRAAESSDAALALNQKLVAINDIYIEDIFEKFQDFWNMGNVYFARGAFAHFLNSPGILYALGVKHGEQTTYEFLGDNNEMIFAHITESLLRTNQRTFTIDWHLSLQEPLIDRRAEGELPLFLQNQRQNQWYTFVEDYGLLYIKINAYLFSAQFAADIANLIDIKGESLRATIIDARTNPGGNDIDFYNFFNALAEATPPGRLFYFMNETSLSAALIAGGYLYGLGAIIVGQPSGQSTDFYAGTLPSFLPNSGFGLPIPSAFFSMRVEFGIESEDLIFRPHVHIEYTIDDWFNNRDPLLEYVLGLL